MSFKTALITTILLAADLAAAHGAIISATGDAGGSGMALGIDTSTPRDGTRRRPFQQDTTRFQGDAEDTVGETLGGGDNDVESGTQAIMDDTGDSLPQVTTGGELSMTLHQVNADGAGPYTCMINDDGTATSWQEITVTENVPGDDGRDRDGEETDFPLTASIPDDQVCSGTVAGQDNVCLVRCENPARNGPFGGVVPVQMVAENGGGNATESSGGTATETNGVEDSEVAGASDTGAGGAESTEAAENEGSNDDTDDDSSGNNASEDTENEGTNDDAEDDSAGNNESEDTENDEDDSTGNDDSDATDTEDRGDGTGNGRGDDTEDRRRFARHLRRSIPLEEMID